MRPDVWAPRAAVVDVVLGDGTRHRLHPDGHGWHRGGPDLDHGTRYGFSLDGSEPLPDPRSRWQPDGIGALSAVDDPPAVWSDAAWRGATVPGNVIYELHVGTFTPAGTFDGAIDHLDDLAALGVTAVELMPVAEGMGDRGWGYDGTQLWAPHHVYGGPDGLRRFVDAAHARGLAVVLDVVYNHLGPQGNALHRFGPYFHDARSTPWGDALNLDGAGSDEVRRFVLDNAHHWFADHHADGLRLDATHHLLDDSPVHLLAELADATERWSQELGRPLWLIAEREQEEVRPILDRSAGGWGLDARWSDDLHHSLHAYLTGERDGYYASFGTLAQVATALERGHVRPGDDLPDGLSSHRLVVCAQNHDQVGNRAHGDRLSHLIGDDAALVAAAVVLLGPATPLLFQGEEWVATTPFPYFCDTDDPTLGDAIREGRRREFAAFEWDPREIPDPLAPATRDAAVLRWAERGEAEHRRALDWYRRLVHLRGARPELRDGDRRRVRAVADEAARVLVVHRTAPEGPGCRVLASWSDAVRPVALPAGFEVLAASKEPTRDGDHLVLAPVSAVVVALPSDGRAVAGGQQG